MIDLAISMDIDRHGITIVETNRGRRLKAPRWPQDCEFQVVSFDHSAHCDVVRPETLAADIALALAALKEAGVMKRRKPDWFHRLERCSNGVAIERGKHTHCI